MAKQIDWLFTVKKRLSWISEMLQVDGMSPLQFNESLGVEYGFNNSKMILYYEYLDANELAGFEAFIFRKLSADPDYLNNVAARSYAVCKAYETYGLYLLSTDWRSKSTVELLQELEKFYRHSLIMIPVVYFDPCVNNVIRELLLQILRFLGKEEEIDTYYLALTSTARELAIVREQRDLLSIGADIQTDEQLVETIRGEMPQEVLNKLPAEIRKRLDEHTENYCWINTDDIYGYPWSEVDFIERIKNLLSTDCHARLNDAIKRQNEREHAYDHAVDELKIDGELLRLINIAREYSYLRTYRTEVYVRTMYRSSFLLREVAARLGLEYKDILYFSIHELMQLLQGIKSIQKSEINDRKMAVAYIMKDRELTLFFGEDAVKLAEMEGLLSERNTAIYEIEGTIANMGLATGAVRIVHDISELCKVQSGDILVASMTIPEFVPAMEIASAFVTDEGGITCHAAILSRELGVPCIIGTEIATKVLHDGDIVVVDAYKGIVRVVDHYEESCQLLSTT